MGNFKCTCAINIHQIWNCLQKQLTALNRLFYLQKAPSQICNRVLNMPLHLLTSKCFIVQKDTDKNMLKYLWYYGTEIQHRNLNDYGNYKKNYELRTKRTVFKGLPIQAYLQSICGWYGHFLFCSIILKSVSNNASLLVMLPKSVQRHFQRGRRRGMQTYLYKFVEIPDYLFDMTWQKFHQIK